MKKPSKIICILIVLFLCLCITFIAGVIVWNLPKTVAESTSPDGNYTVSLIRVERMGLFDFFGSEKGKVLLEKEGEEIGSFATWVATDGASLDQFYWKVTWSDTEVSIVLRGEDGTQTVVFPLKPVKRK